MKNYLFNVFAVMMGVLICVDVYVLITTPPPVESCVNGFLMVKHDDMYIQKDVFPRHCMSIDKD